jgi:ribose transport system ATP-binding protein
MSTVLEGINLTKKFGAATALSRVNFSLDSGEVLGLIGQNGSGKSTLLKTLVGLVEPDEGKLLIRGKEIRLNSSLAATRHGIGMVHQEQSLIPNLTVAENIFLGLPNRARAHGVYRWKRLYEAARRQLEKVEVAIRPDAVIEHLSFAERQMVELAKALAIEELIDHPPIILFDEPTSMLTPGEISILFRQIERLRTRASILFVSHRMEEILAICDRVVVMAEGCKVAEREAGASKRDELYQLMVGHVRPEARRTAAETDKQAPALALRVEDLSATPYFKNVSFDLHKGEIVALAGVLGSGCEELCRSIFGAQDVTAGTILLDRKPIAPRTPADSIRWGIGYLPADRRSEGMLRGRTLVENIVLTFGLEYGHLGLIVNHKREGQEAGRWLTRLKVKAVSPHQAIERLSGGNQQKVVLGKWLLSRTLRVLLLDHPTRGLDPGARDDVFDAMREAAARGLAVLFVGDTVEEMLELADRVLVMKDGEITGSFNLAAGDRPDQADVLSAMI